MFSDPAAEQDLEWPMSNSELRQWFSRSNISIQELTQLWLKMDHNEDTRSEILQLSQSSDAATELENRLRQRIQFGTAGLRGRMEAGFSRMNDLTLIQASQGLAEYVLRHVPNAKDKGIVLGRDHRYHSDTFMRLTGAAFLARGFKVYWFKDFLNHTPLVPYGVKKLGAACGVMITASHNPAMDNGYKVYWENGCQILSPHDTGIQDSIMSNLAPYSWDTDALETDPSAIDITQNLFPEYIKEVVHLSFGSSIPELKPPRFVYTPLHGVGMHIFDQIIYSIGFEGQLTPVAAQASPDPSFRTVKFPNPEEKGALDLAIQTATEEEISLVLANDPDADRFCAAEQAKGQWHIFTGNELGIIFAHHVFMQYKSLSDFDIRKLAMLSSAVSSKMLRSMAKKEGFHHQETLTGFKWLGNISLDLVKEGYIVPYAFEEAIGFMFGDVVRDKDGICAAAVFLKIVIDLYERNQTVFGLLEELYQRYGWFASRNWYVRCEPVAMTNAFHSLRHFHSDEKRLRYIDKVGENKVVWINDVSLGFDSRKDRVLPEDKSVAPSSEMITFEFEDEIVMTLRGSGTEPKLKYYIEAKGLSMEEAQRKATNLETALKGVFSEFGLEA